MTRTSILALALAIVLLTAGCQPTAPADTNANASEVETSPEAASSTSSEADPYSPRAVYKAYMEAYFMSIIASKDWSDPMELEPDRLVEYGMISLDRAGVELPSEGIPTRQLEDAVTAHFAVTPDHLRRSSYYKDREQLYVTQGYGGGASMEVLLVQQTATGLTVTFDVLSGAGERVWGGETTILLATGSGFRYTGNRTWDYGEPAPDPMSAKFWQQSGEALAWEWTFTDSETLAEIHHLLDSGRWLADRPTWPDGGMPIEFLLTDATGQKTAGAFHLAPNDKGYCPGQLGEQWQEFPVEKLETLVALLKKQGLNAQ